MAMKPVPKAGRAKKASGSQPAPVRKGKTTGSARQRASLDVPWNPLGATNGPAGGTGKPAPKKRGKGK